MRLRNWFRVKAACPICNTSLLEEGIFEVDPDSGCLLQVESPLIIIVIGLPVWDQGNQGGSGVVGKYGGSHANMCLRNHWDGAQMRQVVSVGIQGHRL